MKPADSVPALLAELEATAPAQISKQTLAFWFSKIEKQWHSDIHDARSLGYSDGYDDGAEAYEDSI